MVAIPSHHRNTIYSSYTSKGVDVTEIGELTGAILGKDGLIYSYPVIYPIFKIIPITLIFSIFFLI